MSHVIIKDKKYLNFDRYIGNSVLWICWEGNIVGYFDIKYWWDEKKNDQKSWKSSWEKLLEI